jgi:DNA-binding MarR family transcriptional regulator
MARATKPKLAATEPSRLPRFSYVIARIHRSLRGELEIRLAPLGLTVPEYTALSILRRSTGLTNAQLARRTAVSPQAMLGVTSALELAGLIERAPSATHRRVLETHLTRRGLNTLATCDRIVDEVEELVLANLAPDDRDLLTQQLMSCLVALRAGLSERDTRLALLRP